MSTAGGQGNVASSGSVEPASTLPWKRSPLLLKITTATAPAFFAFLILSWKVSAAAPAGPPRLISAIFPLTDAGKSVTSPNPQKTRSEEHTSELQSRLHLVCRLLLEKKQKNK